MSRSACILIAALVGLCYTQQARAGDDPPRPVLKHHGSHPVPLTLLGSAQRQVVAPESHSYRTVPTWYFVEAMKFQDEASAAGSTRVTIKGGVVEIQDGVIRIRGADVLIEVPPAKR